MTFGNALELMLRRIGYSLVSEFITTERRLAVRLRELGTSTIVVMYRSDAIELARGGATVGAIVHRNRLTFPSVAGVRHDAQPAETVDALASQKPFHAGPPARTPLEDRTARSIAGRGVQP